MRKHLKVFIFAGVGLLVVAATAYLLAAQRRASEPSAATSPRVWIVAKHALDELTKDSGARAALSHDTIYVPSLDPSKVTKAEQGLPIVPVKSYQSEAKFEADVAAGSIPKYVKAILYDNETWDLTPAAERQDPVSFYQRGYALAHAHGYVFIATPVPRSLAATVAPYADVLDVQAQSEQQSPDAYLAAVQTIIQQAAQANPKAVILSGLSTNPSAGVPTAQQLVDIAHATYPKLVRGWWLNVPGPGAACPKCNQPRPDIGIQFLKQLGAA